MTASKPESNLADTFNAFASKAAADFPELAPEFAIYNVPTDTLYGHFKPSQKERLLKIARKSIRRGMDRLHGAAAALHPSATGEGHYLMDVFINDPAELSTNALEHELGHLVAPGGVSDNTNFSECVAETFSLLYQQQVHPLRNQSEKSKYEAAWRLLERGDVSHFYPPVLQSLERLSTSYNLKLLTPVQTANLAYRLSFVYGLEKKELKILTEAFKPLQRGYKKLGNGFDKALFKKFAGITLQTKNKDSCLAFMAGKAFLQPLLNKRQDIVTGWSHKDFNIFDGTFWDSIRKKIKQRARQEEAKTPEQRLVQEAKDMKVLGRFDKDPDSKIDPLAYESAENMAYLQRATDAYIKLKSADTPLDPEQIISLARKMAGQPQSLLNSNPRRKIPAAI